MSDKTSIEWTATHNPDGTVTPGATWNPIRARGDLGRHFCLKISDGCRFCYASTFTKRLGGHGYEDVGEDTIRVAKQLVAAGEIYLDEAALLQPLRWRKPRKVFVCSMTDLFGEWVPDDWIARMWTVMGGFYGPDGHLLRVEDRPQHTYQVLTKRPARMRDFLQARYPAGYERPNVWCGVSVELDRYAWRVHDLVQTPAAVRFVSAEPLLGPLPSLPLGVCDCGDYDVQHPNGTGPCGLCAWSTAPYDNCTHFRPMRPAIDWLIVGGESGGPADRRLVARCGNCGSGAPASMCTYCDGQVWLPKREALGWVRDLRDRATAAGVAFHFKQWGGTTHAAGGRLLDGRSWDEFPAVARREAVRA